MSVLARQSILILPFILTSIYLDSSEARISQQPGYRNKNDLLMDRNYNERFRAEDSRPVTTLDPVLLENARKTISQLSPGTRRFLFSPTIQNTITNLNTNQNTNSIETLQDDGGSESTEVPAHRNKEQILGYVNAETGAVEYDLRGKMSKVCFLLS